MNQYLGHLIFLLALGFLASSQVSSAIEKPINTDNNQIKAVKIDRPIKVDGRLDEPQWNLAVPATDFIQLEPVEGSPATERTEVRVLYDRNNLYIGIHCFDKEPKKIIASGMRRDAFLDDSDHIVILLDTFHDHRNCFYFSTNPLGAMLDGLITDEGKGKNYDWNGVWTCATRRDNFGWHAEFSIPFRTLRYSKAENQTWGFNVERVIRRKNENTFWTPMLRDYGFDANLKVSKIGHLTGLQNLPQKPNIGFKPYLLGGLERDYEERKNENLSEIGLDLKYGITSNLIADITYNTDFAQAEADQQQINLTRFSLFFPEKRDFFSEGAGLFQFGEKPKEYGGPPFALLYFSRKIGFAGGKSVPILGGVKATGKVGSTNIGLLNMQVKAAEFFNEDDCMNYLVPATNYSVFRLKQDVMTNSTLGAIILNKESKITEHMRDRIKGELSTSLPDENKYSYNRVFGVDANFGFSQNANIGGVLAHSFTSGLKKKDWFGNLYADWRNDLFSLGCLYTDLGENFKSELGFILRENIRKAEVSLGFSPRPKIPFIRQSFFFAENQFFVNHRNTLVNRNNMIGVFNVFKNGGYLAISYTRGFERLTKDDEFEIRDGEFIQANTYRSSNYWLEFESDPSRKLSLGLTCQGGDFYNGDILSIQERTTLKLRSRLSLLISGQFNWINNLPVLHESRQKQGKIDFNTKVLTSQVNYSYSPRVFARALVQWNSDTEELNANTLIHWIFYPGSDLYIVYNELRERQHAKLAEMDRSILLKLSHLINL